MSKRARRFELRNLSTVERSRYLQDYVTRTPLMGQTARTIRPPYTVWRKRLPVRRVPEPQPIMEMHDVPQTTFYSVIRELSDRAPADHSTFRNASTDDLLKEALMLKLRAKEVETELTHRIAEFNKLNN